MNLLGNQSRKITVLMAHENKQITTHKVKLEDNSTFTLKDKTFVVEVDKMLYSGRKAMLFYNYNSPSPANPQTWTSKFHPKTLRKLLDTKILEELAKGQKQPDDKVSKLIMIFGSVLMIGLIVGFYFTYTLILEMYEIIMEQQGVIDALRDKIVTGGLD